MAIEIERKFLISHIPSGCDDGLHISQGYLQAARDRCVRIRIIEQAACQPKAQITVKGPTDLGAFSRYEFDYDIPIADAQTMLTFCDHDPIVKIRHYYVHHGNTWELDTFLGSNIGLLLAEIELETENAAFDTPPFVTQEVTGNPRYYNLNLAYEPFEIWAQKERNQL